MNLIYLISCSCTGLIAIQKIPGTYKTNEFYWPWNFAENSVISVCLYGYNADLESGFENNLVRIKDLAAAFLEDLSNFRDQQQVKKPPSTVYMLMGNPQE
jgi:hypothetical protein